MKEKLEEKELLQVAGGSTDGNRATDCWKYSSKDECEAQKPYCLWDGDKKSCYENDKPNSGLSISV